MKKNKNNYTDMVTLAPLAAITERLVGANVVGISGADLLRLLAAKGPDGRSIVQAELPGLLGARRR
jgi:hypothetical protein